MTLYLIGLLLMIVCYMVSKTYKQTKALNKDSKYVNAYIDILKGKEGSFVALEDYMKTEKNLETLNKCKIVKVFCDIVDNKDALATAQSINFGTIFKENGKVSANKITTNSDCFVWLLLDFAKASSKGNIEVMNALMDGVNVYKEELDDIVEYKIFASAYNILLNKNNDISFIRQLLSGEYGEYYYDKHLIGVTKKMAIAILAFANEELNDDEKAVLKEFVLTQVGSIFMKDLGISNKYIEEENKQ